MPRLQLVEEVEEGLRREGVVVLKAPWGYGKTTLMQDLAQCARDRASCPVVSVDFLSPEVTAYMSGSDGELGRALSRGSAGGSVVGEADEGMPDVAPARRKGRSSARELYIPARYAGRASRAVWLHLRRLAGPWCRTSVPGEAGRAAELAPLVLIDDLPRLDAAELDDLARALSLWASRGAGIVVACQPSSGLEPGVLPRAVFLGPDMLGVGAQEAGMWVRWLSIARDLDVEALTNGVPMLVGACARVRAGDVAADAGYLHACEHVMSHVLAEPMARAASQVRRAMMVLGHGRLSEAMAVASPMGTRELEELAVSFPVLGIDFARGTFRCPPLAPTPGYSCVRMCVEDDPRLGGRCVERLLARGEAQRAGAVLSFLPPLDRARILEAHPAGFADVLAPEMVAQALDAAQARGFSPGEGAARLRAFVALCRDERPEGALGGFAGDVACVVRFWRDFSGLPAAGADRRGAEGVVGQLGEAGLAGEPARFDEALGRLDDLLSPRRDEGLGEAALRCHAVLCGVLAGRAGQVRAWVAPAAQKARAARTDPLKPCGACDALLSACLALAAGAEELPSASGPGSGLAPVRAAKRFFEDRQVGFAASLCATVHAMLLLACGDASRAEPLLDGQLRRWSQLGCWLGQAAARVGKAHCALMQGRPAQARGHAATALGVAQRLRLPRLERLARLYLVCALLRCPNGCELDEHELIVTSQASSQRGEAGASLLLSQALLAASRGDPDLARGCLEELVQKATPMQMRLAASVVRCMGPDRKAVEECLPRGLLREYRALREPRRTFACEPVLDCRATPCGPTGGYDPDRGLFVNVFGVMGGTLNGHALRPGDWGRSKGLYLTCLLAMAPTGRVARTDLADMLFQSDGRRRRDSALTTTLSCLRLALGQVSGGPEYIVGSMGTLGLNPALVDSDVRRFEEAAMQLTARRDEMTLGELVEGCEVLVRLFGTGPDERLARLHELAARRVGQLCDLFADCMLAGADACYARGELDTAMGFARHASLAAPGRLDVADAHDLVMRARARKTAPPRAVPQAGTAAQGELAAPERTVAEEGTGPREAVVGEEGSAVQDRFDAQKEPAAPELPVERAAPTAPGVAAVREECAAPGLPAEQGLPTALRASEGDPQPQVPVAQVEPAAPEPPVEQAAPALPAFEPRLACEAL